MKLTSDELEQYRNLGFVKSTQKLYSDEDFSRLEKILRSLIDRNADPNTPAHVYDLLQKVPDLLEFIVNKDLLRTVRSILGDDIALFTSSALIKKPYSDAHFKWHSDFYQIEHFDEIAKIDSTVMLLAVDATTIANGCVQYVPNSHERKRRHYNKQETDTEEYASLTRNSNHGLIDGEVDFSNGIITVELPKGHFSFHDIHAVHASEKNKTPNERIVFCLIFFSTNVSNLKPEAIKYLQENRKLKLHLGGQDLHQICRYSIFDK